MQSPKEKKNQWNGSTIGWQKSRELCPKTDYLCSMSMTVGSHSVTFLMCLFLINHFQELMIPKRFNNQWKWCMQKHMLLFMVCHYWWVLECCAFWDIRVFWNNMQCKKCCENTFVLFLSLWFKCTKTNPEIQNPRKIEQGINQWIMWFPFEENTCDRCQYELNLCPSSNCVC